MKSLSSLSFLRSPQGPKEEKGDGSGKRRREKVRFPSGKKVEEEEEEGSFEVPLKRGGGKVPN